MFLILNGRFTSPPSARTSSERQAVKYPDPLPTSRTLAKGFWSMKGSSSFNAAACMWGALMVAPKPMT